MGRYRIDDSGPVQRAQIKHPPPSESFADRSRPFSRLSINRQGNRTSSDRASAVASARIKRHVRAGQSSPAHVFRPLVLPSQRFNYSRDRRCWSRNASVIYSLACLRHETSSLPDGRWILEETETVARQSERPTVEAAAAALSRSRRQRWTFFV